MISSNLLHSRPTNISLKVVMATVILVLAWVVPCISAPQKLGQLPLNTNTNPHNLSSESANPIKSVETDQICVFCHTPHNAKSADPLWDGPLMNRSDITSPLGGGSFPLYGEKVSDPRLDEILIDDIAEAKYGDGSLYPNGSTRLCLSCHDGVTAMGAVISSPDGSISLGPMTTMVVDLSTSHPVSFTYVAAVEILLDSKPGVTAGQYRLPPADILDAESRMQCTACHDPHLDTNDGTYTLPMWRNYSGNENTDYEGTCGYCHLGVTPSASGGLVRPSPGGIHPIP